MVPFQEEVPFREVLEVVPFLGEPGAGVVLTGQQRLHPGPPWTGAAPLPELHSAPSCLNVVQAQRGPGRRGPHQSGTPSHA